MVQWICGRLQQVLGEWVGPSMSISRGYGVYLCVCVQDVEVSMFADVDRLKNILSELGDTISQPNTLPVTTKDFIEVCMCVSMHLDVYVCVCIC